MRILFLDDDERRLHLAWDQAKSLDHNIDLVSTVEEFVKQVDFAVKQNHRYYDLISLDHDLGNEIFTPSDGKSGFACAAKLVKEGVAPLGNPLVIVHSYNPVGAEKMLTLLKEAGFLAHRRRFSPGAPLPLEAVEKVDEKIKKSLDKEEEKC